ncbi:MAG: methionyl-tRNA formyltransferase [bacterium]
MRIVLIGQAAFGAKVLEALAKRNHEMVAAYTIPDQPGQRPDPLKEASVSGGVKVVQPGTYRDEQVFSEYRSLRPDLTVMAFVTDIIPARYFGVPLQGTINFHPSLLPRHRGGSAVNWAVIMGDEKTGISIFWPDEGIDTGPILLQKEAAIAADDTTGSLYFNRLFPIGVEAILEAVGLIEAGRAPRIPQDEALATYEPLCNDRVAAIDWGKPAGEVYNLVRGCDPQPGAFSFIGGQKVRFYAPGLVPVAVDDAPGTVLGIDEQGLRVALAGGQLAVGKAKVEIGGKEKAAELAARMGIRAGDRFSSQG